MEILNTIFQVFITELKKMWFFTLLSILIAALIKTYQWDLKIRMLLQKKIKTGIFFATFVGMASPLCSCGILPIAISLAAAGVPLPPLVSLLFTSPVMGPEALVITYGGLGFDFAMGKLIFSLFFGLLMGFCFLLLQKFKYYDESSIRIVPVYNERGELKSSFEIACENKIRIKTMTVFPRDSKFRFFLDRFIDMGLFIGSLTLLAILLEAFMYALVPQSILKEVLSYHGISAFFITAFFGLLIPLNQIAAVPIIKGLTNLGMPLSLGMVLMFSGAVTSIPSMIVLYKIFKPRVLILFLLLCLIFSMLTGIIYNFFVI
ncbi:MAG: permease [Proteobacteria bacterium]|nr:permease [Pseudomonadota bacterium]